MTATTWRAGEIALPDGVAAVDVSGSGRLTRQTVTAHRGGESRELGELADGFASSRADVGALAAADPVGFAYLVCLLSDRPHHVFPRESMWPELELYFGLCRAENEPHVTDGRFQFVAYSQYMPTLRSSRLTVDLATLAVAEEPLVCAVWPPATATASGYRRAEIRVRRPSRLVRWRVYHTRSLEGMRRRSGCGAGTSGRTATSSPAARRTTR